MKATCVHFFRFSMYLILLTGGSIASAHDAENLNAAMIERTNETVVEQVLAIQGILTELIRSAGDEGTWPDPELSRLNDDLRHLEEDTAMSLDYFVNEGINLQDKDILKSNPIAGRAVAARRAIETGLALIEHIASLQDRDTFVREIYNQGLAYYMYDLLTAYRDKLSLYEALRDSAE